MCVKRVSRLYRMVRCPFHDDTRPSLAIYENDDGFSYYCFGCHEWGKLDESELDEISCENRKTVNVSYYEEKTISEETYLKFLRERRISKNIAESYGLKKTPSGVLIPIYDDSNNLVGYQVRRLDDMHPKYVLRPSPSGTFPKMGVFSTLKPNIFVVESVIDGLSLVSRKKYRNFGFIALLGTYLRVERPIFVTHKNFFIVFDEDAYFKQFDIAMRLKQLTTSCTVSVAKKSSSPVWKRRNLEFQEV